MRELFNKLKLHRNKKETTPQACAEQLFGNTVAFIEERINDLHNKPQQYLTPDSASIVFFSKPHSELIGQDMYLAQDNLYPQTILTFLAGNETQPPAVILWNVRKYSRLPEDQLDYGIMAYRFVTTEDADQQWLKQQLNKHIFGNALLVHEETIGLWSIERPTMLDREKGFSSTIRSPQVPNVEEQFRRAAASSDSETPNPSSADIAQALFDIWVSWQPNVHFSDQKKTYVYTLPVPFAPILIRSGSLATPRFEPETRIIEQDDFQRWLDSVGNEHYEIVLHSEAHYVVVQHRVISSGELVVIQTDLLPQPRSFVRWADALSNIARLKL